MSKLLTIAIPTWNRAAILDKALEKILLQVNRCFLDIEFIISNNNSTDNTDAIIKKWISYYPNIDIIYNNQNRNVGFYGNFKFCRELSTGKFIWLLSDDDFVLPNTINEILMLLKNKESTLSFIYLDIIKKDIKTSIINTTFDNIFYKYNRKLTFISGVIFLNNKINDEFLFNKFNESNLLGFVLLIDIFRYNRKEAIILKGNLLDCGKDNPKGYNWFDAFVFNISEILLYMNDLKFKKNIIRKIENSLILNSYLKRYFYLKAFNRLDGELNSYSIKDVNRLLYNRYRFKFLFWIFIFPLMITPSIILKFTFPLINYIRDTFRR